MEFRLYDKVDCSIFDLIGKLEPDQTKALGILFAKSMSSLNSFLSLIGKSHIRFDKYVVDCEPRDINNKRFDVLIRFYRKHLLLEAILIEAKSIKVSNSLHRSVKQLIGYANFNQLNGFTNQTLVTLTRDTKINTHSAMGVGVKSITWSQLISALRGVKDSLANDYVRYITSIQGTMNYYDKEILAIPAGMSLPAILASGLYVCPANGKHYANQSKTLYLAFKDSKGGMMDTIYKVKDIIEGIDLNDSSHISILQNMPVYSNISARIQSYKQKANFPTNSHIPHRLFILDLNNSIALPNKVRPLVNNSNRTYYSLKEFLQPINSNKNCVVLQRYWEIRNNTLNINITNLSNQIEIFDDKGCLIQKYTKSGTCILNSNMNYTIIISNVTRGKRICAVDFKYDGNKNIWVEKIIL